MPRPAHKLTVLAPYPVSARDAETWGFARLAARGFDVACADVGPLFGVVFPAPVSGTAADGGWRSIPVGSAADLRALLADRGDGFFLDFVLGLSDIGLREAPLYEALHDARARLVVVQGGVVPLVAGSSVAGLAGLARRAADPYRWVNLFAKRRIRRERAAGERYALPVRVFASHSAERDAYVSRYPSLASACVPINSYDFDRYLAYVEGGGEVVAGDTCVFIDEGVAGHPDFAYLRVAALDPEAYFAEMRALFDRIKAASGLRVVIAGHPKVDYRALGDVWGGRELLVGSTLEAVARSGAVVTHASTAVSYAVLFDKPLLLATTSGMRRTGYDARVSATAAALGLEPLSAPAAASQPGSALDPATWSRAGFSSYRDRYVADPDAPRANTWDIVADELERIIADEAAGAGRLSQAAPPTPHATGEGREATA